LTLHKLNGWKIIIRETWNLSFTHVYILKHSFIRTHHLVNCETEWHFSVLPYKKSWDTLIRLTASRTQNRPWKLRGGVKLQLYCFVNLGTRWKRVVNTLLQPLYAQEETWYPWYRRMDGAKGQSEQKQKITPPTGISSLGHPMHGESLYLLCYPSPLKNTGPDCKQRIYFQCIPYCGPHMLKEHMYISPVLIPWSDRIAGRLLIFSKELKWWTPWCKPYIPFWWAGNPVKIAERLQ